MGMRDAARLLSETLAEEKNTDQALTSLAERALREQGVCVVSGAFFGAPAHIRLGLPTLRMASAASRSGSARRC